MLQMLLRNFYYFIVGEKEMSTEEKEKTIVCFDATELDNFEMCTFRWHAFHHRHLRPKQTESYFEKGTLIHYLLELYYKQFMVGLVTKDYIEWIVEQGRIKSLEFDLSLEEVSEHFYQFREYARFYAEENITPLYIEEPFMVELYEDEDLKVLLSGQPDLIFKYTGTNNVAVMDHKRMQREFPYSPMRNQFLLYATAMKTDTVIVNKIGFQKTKAPKDRFVRTPFIYSQEILDEWKQDAINRAKEMVVYEKVGHFPRNRTSCEKFNGCYLQRYCSTKPRAREFLIGTEYLVGKEWDVSQKLEPK